MTAGLRGEYDVVIVGAGPAGIAAAIQLRRGGMSPVVLEKASGPRDKPCGGAVSPRAVNLYGKLGLPAEYFEKTGRRENRGNIEGFGRLLKGCSRREQFGYFIERRELDWDFQQAAVNNGQAEIFYGTRLTGLTFTGRGIRAVVEKANTKQAVLCRYLIAADGAASLVRSKLFGPGIRDHDIILTAGAVIAHPGCDLPYVRFHEDHLPTYSWIFPYRDGNVNIGIGIYRSVYRKKKADPEIFGDLICRMNQNFSGIGLKRWFINTNPLQFRKRKNRVFLVGDAGGYVDPLTGEGIYYALRSGLSIGRVIPLIDRYGGLCCSLYDLLMFPSLLRLIVSKAVQLILFYFPGAGAAIFAACARNKFLNGMFFRYFSNG